MWVHQSKGTPRHQSVMTENHHSLSGEPLDRDLFGCFWILAEHQHFASQPFGFELLPKTSQAASLTKGPTHFGIFWIREMMEMDVSTVRDLPKIRHDQTKPNLSPVTQTALRVRCLETTTWNSVAHYLISPPPLEVEFLDGRRKTTYKYQQRLHRQNLTRNQMVHEHQNTIRCKIM